MISFRNTYEYKLLKDTLLSLILVVYAIGIGFMMKNNKFLLLLCVCQCVGSSGYTVGESMMFASEDSKKIAINNRILANVNGKAISVLDVMKKMDIQFYRSFPQYTSSTPARFQFYQLHWKKILQDLIDKELIMADAADNKLQVTNGDVRQDMEQLFGPNIHENLHKVGVSYPEAWKSVYDDIVIKRMIYIRSTSKALKRVTPQVVQTAYQEFAKANMRPDQWIYSVISIRDKDKKIGADAAQIVYRLLTDNQNPVPMKDLVEKARSITTVAPTTKITVSEEFSHDDPVISASYKESLLKLTSGSFSHPEAQTSRADGSTVYRIFYLKEWKQGGPIPFQEVGDKIKERLLEQAAAEETEAYLKRLHKHFDVHECHLEEIGEEKFEPFHLI